MELNNKEWHVKACIHQSAKKISIIHSQYSLPFSSIKMSVGAKRVFLQLNNCKDLYHQSQREHENNSQHQNNKVTQ